MAECLLCGANAVNTRQDYSSRTIYNCGYCGTYVVSDMTLTDVRKHSGELAAYLYHRQLSGKRDTLLISYDSSNLDKGYLQLTVEQILEMLPKSFSKQLDGALENLALLSTYHGEEIMVDSLQKAPLFYMRVKSFDALSFVIKAMVNAGFLEVNYYSGSFFPCGVTVSPAGWLHIDSLVRESESEKKALTFFCSQETQLSGQARTAARSVAAECGLNFLGCEPLTHVSVGNELVAKLRHCDIAVFDLTEAREDVYYAMGFARALNKPLAIVCHEKKLGGIKLDTAQTCVISWQEEKDLHLQLYHYIRAWLL